MVIMGGAISPVIATVSLIAVTLITAAERWLELVKAVAVSGGVYQAIVRGNW